MAPSFSRPLHQPGAGIAAGTDEMLFVLHLLSHGASWRTEDFLGFTPVCATRKDGRFKVRRVTSKKRLRAKLHEVKAELRWRRHEPIPEQGRWLAAVVRGHCAYYAVPDNIDAVSAFRDQVTRHWRQALRRRSQRSRMTWERVHRLAHRWRPPIRITHPWPSARLAVRTQGRSPVR